jgi:hypothetical protein
VVVVEDAGKGEKEAHEMKSPLLLMRIKKPKK